jgi:transposase
MRHGYSKDHRPDLKQAVLNLICTHQGAIPVWLEALSGNSQDKTTFPATIQAYLQQWEASEDIYFIVDSALYGEKNIQVLEGQCRWVTRVPETLAGAQELLAALGREQMEEWGEGYWGTEVGSLYGGVKQRWVVVFSQAAWEREQKSLAKRLREAGEQARKQWQDLSRQEWPSPEEAQQAVVQAEKKWRYHRAEYVLQEVPHYEKRGRPKAAQPPAWTGWRVEGQVVEEEAAVAAEQQKQGKFILATNELDSARLPGPQMLGDYKKQGSTVERGFRFLKDPWFFASGLFVKKASRLMAVLMIMGLALLIYALAEHQIRQALQQRNETIPNQVGKGTQRPTLWRLFQVFEGIDILVVAGAEGLCRRVLNLRPQHRQILDLWGPQVQACYLWDPGGRETPAPPAPPDGTSGSKCHFDDAVVSHFLAGDV